MTEPRRVLLRCLVVVIACGVSLLEGGCGSAAVLQDASTVNIGGSSQSAPTPFPLPGTAAMSLVNQEGTDAVRARCVTCHEPAMLLQQRLSAQQWMAEIEKMERWGAQVSDEEKIRIASYLVMIAGPNNTSFTPRIVAPVRGSDGR